MSLKEYFKIQYRRDLEKFYRSHINKSGQILEINAHKVPILNVLGLDKDEKNVVLSVDEMPDGSTKYDYIIISDTLASTKDIQSLFHNLYLVSKPKTRVIINYHNFLWLPLLALVEKIGLKDPQQRSNWLNTSDVVNLLTVENFEVVKSGKRFLFPFQIPALTIFFNRYLTQLPIFHTLNLVNYLIARPKMDIEDLNTVSVVIPARNESGNIENAVLRTPLMGKNTEIIFVEGNSTDDTWNEIKRVAEKHPTKNIKYIQQSGKGKGDAVRTGFSIASGEILMILDADLTVPPEDLIKFYHAISTNKGEYINGSRLVYPMEGEAMQFLNIIGNKFFSNVFSWLLDQRIKDTLCGTKVLSRQNYLELVKNRSYFGEFDPFGDFDLIFGSSKLDLKFVEIPIRYGARTYGSTNISRFKHGWLLLKMVFFALNKVKFVE